MTWLLIAMGVLLIVWFFLAILLCVRRVRELDEETRSGARWPW